MELLDYRKQNLRSTSINAHYREEFAKCGVFDAFSKLRKAIISFVMSVRPCVLPPVRLLFCLSAWNSSAPTEGILMKRYFCIFLKSVQKI